MPNAPFIITDLMLVGHMRNHTAAVTVDRSLKQGLSGSNCRQQQQAGRRIHNSVAHSSAERNVQKHNINRLIKRQHFDYLFHAFKDMFT